MSLEEQCHTNQDFVVLWGELSPKEGDALACGPNSCHSHILHYEDVDQKIKEIFHAHGG